MKDRRVFSSLPKVFQTDVNKRLLGATDDLAFEPEAFERIEGQIGDDTDISQSTKDRSPFITNSNPLDDRFQLSPCVVSYNKDGSVANGAFYADLIGHILANGGLTSDENRLFECDYFSFTPPINIDKWVNFSKYFWTGDGTADDTGEYIVKEPTASQTVLHYVEANGTFTKKAVILDSSDRLAPLASYEPTGTLTGDLREDCTDAQRTIYQWDGTAWQVVNIAPYASEDAVPSDIAAGTYLYIARTGKNYQRPVIYHYSGEAGRWLSKVPVISNREPDNPVEGMIWEDSRSPASRKFLLYTNEGWAPLVYSTIPYFDTLDSDNDIASMTAIGVPTGNDPVYRYAAIDFTVNDDPWQKENWWVHFEDLSAIDKTEYNGKQSKRPLLEYWSSIETTDISDALASYKIFGLNNVQPKYEIYMVDNGGISKASTFVDTYNGNSLFEYKQTRTNSDDTVLGFPLTYDSTGEIIFDLTLESTVYTKNNISVLGYRFFKDTWTGQLHSVWNRSTTPLVYDQTQKGVPLNLSNNPNHDIITSISRSNIINHYRNILDTNADGIPLGNNNYRWTSRDPVSGATIIDTEGSLLIPLSLIQNDDYDLAEAIRNMSFEYNRFMKRFVRRLSTIWDAGSYSTPQGTLNGLTATEMVDKVLTQNILFSTEESPFWNAGMGTYVNETTAAVSPILIPPSAARTGAAPAYTPRKFTTNSITYILKHDGSVMLAYNDERDDVIINLENRFFASVPAKRKLESVAESAFLDGHQFSLKNHIGNKTIITNVPDVDNIVNDYTALSPTEGDRVYSKTHGMYATYSNSAWVTKKAVASDIVKNLTDDTKHTFNGFDIFELKAFDRSGVFDYQSSDYTTVIRREFERWYVDQGLDPVTNDGYSEANKWTWNYTSAGFEGHWTGIYKRVYGTDRPHVAPWEILGFTIKPAWWDDAYTVTSTDADGNGRYGSANAMWADLKTGTLIAAEGVTIPTKFLLSATAPIPVDVNGDLIDPVTAGVVSLDQLISPEQNWKYGDCSPIENSFHNSHLGPFAYALAGYLMKPGRYVEFLWSDYSFTIGMDTNLFGGPIKIDDGTLRRPKIDDLKIHSEDINYSNPGINAWVAENLNMSRINSKEFADTIRQSNVSLGWKTNGFIDKAATVIKTSSGVEIPFEDVQLTLHKGLPIENKFHSGIQILKRGSKYQVYGYDYTNSFFRINYGARPSLAGRTTFNETYTVQTGIDTYTLTKFKLGGTNDLAKFSVLVDGFKVKDQYINILSPTSFQIIDPNITTGQQLTAQLTTTYTNPSTRSRKFSIGETDYFYYETGTNNIIDYQYGHQFNSPQEVVEFIVDYGRNYTDNGWVYENDDWIDVAKRFAVWSQTATTGQIFVDVASGNSLNLQSTFGHMNNIQKLVYGGYSLLDIAGMPITEFDTYRFDGDISVKSPHLIFGLRATIVDIQHAVFISNRTRFNDLVYDPFTGLRQKRLEIKSLRTKEWAGRLDTPGYIASGDKLVPNFEKSTKDFIRYYDMLDPVSDPKFRDQAFNLYGWYYRDYAREMNINEVMSLEFHKNSIREKGTRRAVSGFSISKNNNIPLEILECWAWKEGEFGKTSFDNPVRFNILETDFNNRIQSVIFGSTNEPGVVTISDYDRSQTHAKWIVPPRQGNFKFPIKGNATSPDYDIRAVVLEGEVLDKKMFHYDPINGLHEPIAYSQIDIETSFDPAYYNKGVATTDEGYEWSSSRVGTIWWNTSNREYQDYLNQSLTLKESSENWGKLKSYAISSSAVANTISIKSVVEAGHNIVVNQSITVETRDGQRISGMVDVVSGNDVTYTLLNGPETVSILSNALLLSNIITITNRSIDIYEWIESRVPPTEYSGDEDDVIIFNAASPSYTEVTQSDGSRRYYFWVKNKRSTISGKLLSAYQISNQLYDPTVALIPWFGVFNATSMMFNAAALDTRNDLSIQIFTFPKQHEEHDQWVILVENDKRNYINDGVVEKMIDSLQGTDIFDNPVPASYRTDLDKYGTETGQIIYSDLEGAKVAFLNSINAILKTYDKNVSPGFTSAFPSSFEYPSNPNGYWEVSEYDILGYVPSQVVNSVSDRDQLIDMYVGDAVRVKETPSHSYQYTSDGEWTKVQASTGSAQINNQVFADLRNILSNIKLYITIEDYNHIMFDIIYEMMRQQKNCDWCYKTSYFDLINTINTGQPSNNPFNETDVVIKSVNDNKPYHSKARRTIASHIIHDGDNTYDEAQLTISDQHYSKIALFSDRLSFNTFDDNGFDTEPFDVFEFDFQTWDRPELGTLNTELLITFTNTEEFNKVFPVGKTFPYLEHTVSAINIATGVTVPIPPFRLLFDNEELTIVFDTAPPPDVLFSVRRDYGYASPGLLNLSSIDDNFVLTDSTYQHAVAVTGVDWADIADGAAVDDMDGGDADERVRSDVLDSSIIKTTVHHTGLYGTFDGNGFDTAPFDTMVAQSTPSSFETHITNIYPAESLTETITLGKTITISSTLSIGSRIAMTGDRFGIGRVQFNIQSGGYVTQTEGVGFLFDVNDPRSIILLTTLASGDKIRLMANSVRLKHNQFKITATTVSDYTINNRTISISGTVAVGDTIDITYYADALVKDKSTFAEYASFIRYVDDKQTDHTDLTGQSSVITGYRVLNDVDDNIYTWTGSAWVSETTDATKSYYVNSEKVSYNLSAGDWVQSFIPGDSNYDLTYEWIGQGSSLQGSGMSEYGPTAFGNSWEIAHKPAPANTTDIIGWWSNSSMIMLDQDNDVSMWVDASGNGNHLLPPAVADAPPFLKNNNPLLNSVNIDDAYALSAATNTNMDDVFGDGGYIAMMINIASTGATSGYIIHKVGDFNIRTITGAGGNAFELRFSKEFSTTDGLWDIEDGSLAFDTNYFVEIIYDSSDVANNPTARINGVAATVTEDTAPVGTGSSGASALIIGNNTGKTDNMDGKVYQILVMAAEASHADEDIDYSDDVLTKYKGLLG